MSEKHDKAYLLRVNKAVVAASSSLIEEALTSEFKGDVIYNTCLRVKKVMEKLITFGKPETVTEKEENCKTTKTSLN